MQAEVLLNQKVDLDKIRIIHAENDRKIDSELEQKVDEYWKEFYTQAKADGKHIWDGDNYRLNKWKFEDGVLHLEFSTIKFSKRLPLMKFAAEGFIDDSKYCAKGCGVGALVKTSDGKYLFGQKSGKTAAAAKVDIIGGILEGCKLEKGWDLAELLFNEIFEEINVDRNQILNIDLRGFLSSVTGNYVFLFSVQLDIDSVKVKELFLSRKDDELSEVIVVAETEVKEYLRSLESYRSLISDLL